MEPQIKYETLDEAYDILQNGILVETNKGLVCMSLNDALCSNLNLSEEDLRDVATKLILQQSPKDKPANAFLKTATSHLNFDSDGFSSECSDGSASSAGAPMPTFIFASLPKAVVAIKEEQPEPTVTFLPVVAGHDISILKTECLQEPAQAAAVEQVQVVQAPDEVHKPPKRRGGWPKGRKRKPELLNLPPKAPATGYNLYLNEQRKLFKDTSLVFHEITKIIGNKWSNLTLNEKEPYLQRAEEDKRRYREELKQYRQSDAYRAYLLKKRRNRLQNSALSESDMDATDEIDDEDNEELYCRTCDQWFHNLHNKREHLQGRQHTQSVAGDIRRELDSDFASASSSSEQADTKVASAVSVAQAKEAKYSNSISDCMATLAGAVNQRETEIKSLERRLQETCQAQSALCQQVNALRQRQSKLKNDLSSLKDRERDMEARVSQLWQVPSWFIMTDFNATDFVNE